MKIVVTGGCGFIGSNFIHYMFRTHDDVEIVNIDKLTYAGNPVNVAMYDSDERYSFFKADIADANAVRKIIDGSVDAIVNFAAESHVDRSIMNCDDFIDSNIRGVANLLYIVKDKGIPRFIQVSTDEVYGSCEDGSAFTEKTPLAPNNPYAATKAAADVLVQSFYNTYKLSVIITRCSNNFGPYQFPEKVIPLFITNLLEGKKVPLYGDGLNERDWIYVEDHCRAIDAVLQRGALGRVYNIGCGAGISNLELTKKLLRLMKKDDEYIEYVKDRPGHDRRYCMDYSRMRNELDWRPQYKFDQALEKTVQWYLDNPEWWKAIKTGKYLDYYRKQYEERT